jgi:hypothetical protein
MKLDKQLQRRYRYGVGEGLQGMVKPYVDDCVNFVFFDEAEYYHGVPVNCKGVISGCQESSFVKYIEYSAARRFTSHCRLSGIGQNSGFLVFGLYGNPTNWTGRDGTGTPPLSSFLPQLPRICHEHPKLRILIDYSFEAGLGEYFFEGMTDFVHSLNVDPSRVVVLVSNHGIEARYDRYLQSTNKIASTCFKIVGEDFWLLFSGLEYSRKHWPDAPDRIVSEGDAERLSNTIRQKKFLSLNRRPRWHRFLLSFMIEATGLHEQGIISMPSKGYHGDWVPEDHYLDFVGSQMAPSNWKTLQQASTRIFPALPWVIDIEMGEQQWFLNTYVQIVTETAMEGEREDVFITEKTCKALANLQPFLVFGHANHLARLAHHGFARLEMFDDGYDAANNVGERLDKLFARMVQLQAWTTADIHELYHAELPRLRFNQHRLLEYPSILGRRIVARLSEALQI